MTAIPAYDPELVPGARNAIHVCLRVQPAERVVMIADHATREVADALADQVREAGAPLARYTLEEHGARPMSAMPEAILAGLEQAEVSIYAAQPQAGELPTRIAMTEVVNRRRIRHAHMVGISRRIMVEGMRADFAAVDALSRRVHQRAATATRIRARSRAGSDLEATFDPAVRWLKTSGIISPEKWANLPGGEVLTAPARVDGVYVADGVLGDYLCARFGDLAETPLVVTIEDSRVADVRCDRAEVAEAFRQYTAQHENSDRVGEFAIGTNLAVSGVIGNILQDEKIPGLHIAFGHPYAEHTGARWKCPTHLDIVGRGFDVWIDGDQVMADSRFLIG